MKNIFIIAMTALVCFCGCRKTATVEGKVLDATMGNIVLATAEGEFVVNTLDSDPTKVIGVLIGDVVKVEYSSCQTEDGQTINSVESLELVSPSYYRLITGTWMMSVLEDGDKIGFTFAEDGTAESVNMKNLDIRNYVLDIKDDVEELAVTAISDGAAEPETMTVVYEIVKLDADSLVLRNKETEALEWVCGRLTE